MNNDKDKEKIEELKKEMADLNARAVKVQDELNKLVENSNIQMSEQNSGPQLINL